MARALMLLCLVVGSLRGQQDARLGAFHGITNAKLMGHVLELCDPKYGGRLSGTPEYMASARWCAEQLKGWGIKPGAVNGTWFQTFPNPYTLVKPGCALSLHVAQGTDVITKSYVVETEFFPGGTSDAGKVTAEAVYVGYGITAPELGYDDYAGVDVKGKVVVLEPEQPYRGGEGDVFKQWRPYSFHEDKTRNAVAHGAVGVIYNYLIANPNNVWRKGLLTAAAGQVFMDDLFAGSGRRHRETLKAISQTMRPASFATGKHVTLAMDTEHHPEGVGCNVVGLLEGTDPALKGEVLLVGAHLDHLGYQPLLISGANDNVSACAVLLGVAEALSRTPPKRSVVFVLFGAEEQGVKGSEHYVQHPTVPLKQVKAMFNLESVGRGDGIFGGFGKNFPDVWKAFEAANDRYVHRSLRASLERNQARPRQDAMHFFWAKVPTIAFGTYGGPELPFAWYHTSHDKVEHLNPEVMRDLARLLYLGVLGLGAN